MNFQEKKSANLRQNKHKNIIKIMLVLHTKISWASPHYYRHKHWLTLIELLPCVPNTMLSTLFTVSRQASALLMEQLLRADAGSLNHLKTHSFSYMMVDAGCQLGLLAGMPACSLNLPHNMVTEFQ